MMRSTNKTSIFNPEHAILQSRNSNPHNSELFLKKSKSIWQNWATLILITIFFWFFVVNFLSMKLDLTVHKQFHINNAEAAKFIFCMNIDTNYKINILDITLSSYYP